MADSMDEVVMQARPLKMLLVMLAGWMNRHQQEMIEYLKEENRILREKLGGKRILLSDSQRGQLAILGKKLGRELLGQVCCAFSPDTLMKWHRRLVARKYDGIKNRSRYGRPRISDELKQLIIDMAKNHKHLECRRLHGYLKYLGLKVSPATIREFDLRNQAFPSLTGPELWFSKDWPPIPLSISNSKESKSLNFGGELPFGGEIHVLQS